ncbi:MAG: hypothetical protein HY305_01060, partial [Sphingobacteriales bacterium]|nr:hypothetical protein [Sphingobacteriales bacterium]
MKKYLLTTLCILFITNIVTAQTKQEKKYKVRATEIQQEIWNNADKAFDVTTVPDKYKGEGAVIIAKSVFVNPVDNVLTRSISRERVLIMDKAALEEYSTMSYTKIIDKSVRYNFYQKTDNYAKSYIGIKICKKDGKVIVINTTDEEILTENRDKEKAGKIAIPDLQLGDIVDYYYCVERVNENVWKYSNTDKYYLGDNHPILYYSVKYQLNNTCTASILSANGAKPITEILDENGNITLQFTERDISRFDNNAMWTSVARNIPYYIISYLEQSARKSAEMEDKISHGPFATSKRPSPYEYTSLSMYTAYPDIIKYYGGRGEVKRQPTDSLITYFYNYYRWKKYGTFTNMRVTRNRNYEDGDDVNYAREFVLMLKIYGIPCDVITACDRFSVKMDNIFTSNDLHSFIRVNFNGKPTFICFNDCFQDIGGLNVDYQGEKAFVMTREKREKFEQLDSLIKLPVAKSSDNVSTEKIKVSFYKENLLTTFERTCTETGYMKNGDQKNLLLPEDIEAKLSEIILPVINDIELLNIKMPRNTFQNQCLNNVYDDGCKLNKTDFLVNASVESGSSKTIISTNASQTSGWFDGGQVIFITGEN